MSYEERMKELGIVLPEAGKPVAAYIPALQSGRWIYTAGQLPRTAGKLLHPGHLGDEVSVEQGSEAARLCALNALAAVRSVLGSLDRIERIVKVVGYVSSAENFFEQPKVLNGASELLLSIFGEHGKHVRSAVGVSQLPLNASVEVELIVEVRED